jgi:hypothetical protein
VFSSRKDPSPTKDARSIREVSRRRRSPVQQTSQGRSKLTHSEKLKIALEPGALEFEAVEEERSKSAAETRMYGSIGTPVKARASGPSVVYCSVCSKPMIGAPGSTCESCVAATPKLRWAPEREKLESTVPASTPRHLTPQPREALSRLKPTWSSGGKNKKQ